MGPSNKMNPMPVESRPRYVFICSAGHSGSTLLDLLLGGNRQVTSLGEITHLPKNLALNTRCTCGAPVRSCELWSAVIADISLEMGVRVETNPYMLDLGFIDAHKVIDKSHQTFWYKVIQKWLLGFYYLYLRYGIPLIPAIGRHFDRVSENNWRLYETVLRATGKSVVVDSSKSYFKALAFYRHYPQDTRIIALARDGRGVFYSGLRRGARPRAAYYAWRHHYAHALPLYKRQLDPEHLLFIKYESLAREPAAELHRICSFLKITYEDGMLNRNDTIRHITNGNDMRFSTGPIRLDETWRNALTASQTHYFDIRGKKLNSSLGYD